MPTFLIDANLPYHFSIWKDEAYIHQFDINDEWSDSKIWEYSKEHSLTIVTKDSDFSNRIIFNTPPPKVIHVRFGNLKMKDFYNRMHEVWPEVLKLNQNFKLINIFIDRIEGIN